MKKTLPLLSTFLAFWIAMGLSQALYSQDVSSRTGNPPPKQEITLAEFNASPAEIQEIIKNHPELYVIEKKPQTISLDEYNLLPAEKQKYMKEHPKEFIIQKSENTSVDSPTGQSNTGRAD